MNGMRTDEPDGIDLFGQCIGDVDQHRADADVQGVRTARRARPLLSGRCWEHLGTVDPRLPGPIGERAHRARGVPNQPREGGRGRTPVELTTRRAVRLDVAAFGSVVDETH